MKEKIETLMHRALTFALHNPHSDFYRRKYGAEFEALLSQSVAAVPFLTRPEIEAVPLRSRVFVPQTMVRFIRSTSGSTGKNVIGFPMLEEGLYQEYLKSIGHVPVSGQLSRYFEPYFSSMNIKSQLLFSAGSFVHEVRVRGMEGRMFISGDFTQPKLTARLAAEAQVDAVVGSPSGLVSFAPFLKALDGCRAVRLVVAVGELATTLQFTKLQEFFPNAKIASQYGLTESQGFVGYTCPEKMSSDPKAFHVAEGSLFIELISPETGESLPLTAGTEGELVITTHEPQAFPLIRYRTGDFARIRSETCSCEGSPLLFECMGRLTLDRIRVPRGVLTIAAVDQAVAGLSIEIKEFAASWDAAGEVPGLSITLYMDEGDGELDEAIAKTLSEGIKIAPALSYADIVAEGSVRPIVIECRPVEAWIGWSKKKRLL